MKNFLLIITVILLLSPPAEAPTISGSTADHLSQSYSFKKASKTIELKSFWRQPPSIIICNRAATVSRVERAVRFWKRLGYKFGKITKHEDPFNCTTDKHNKIRIMLPNRTHNMNNELAITLTDRVLTTSEATSADIIIHSFAAGKELVLEHEIGHALGWQHISSPGHLMYPEYRLVGHNTARIDYDEYTKIIRTKFAND